MARRFHDLTRRPGLHDVAGIDHADAVAHLRDDTEVVGDQYDGCSALALLQAAQQLEDLGLHRDVEGGGRLVGDDELGVQDQRAGDDDALLHAAAELVRIAAVAAARLRYADLLEHLDHAPADRFRPHIRVVAQQFGDLPADGHDRVERAGRVLEDHRDAGTADVAHLVGGLGQQILAVEPDAAGCDAAGRLDQPHDRLGDGGLAAAALADNAQRLPSVHRQTYAVDRLQEAALGAELRDEAVDLQQHARPPAQIRASRGS